MSWLDFNDPNDMALWGALGNVLTVGSTPHPGASGMGAGNALLALGGAGLQGAVTGAQAAQKYQAGDIANQTAGLGLERQKAIQPYQIDMIKKMMGGQAPGSLAGGVTGPTSISDGLFQQAYATALASGDMAKVSAVLTSWAEHSPQLAGAIEKEKQRVSVHEGPNGPYVGYPGGGDISDQAPAQAYGSISPQGTNPMLPNLVQAESGGDPSAISPKGAAGAFQIMPATATDPGFGVQPLHNWDGKDPRTAPQAEQQRFANDYLNMNQQRYGGDPRLAAAGYNAGPGAVDRALGKLPAETQAYVPKVTRGIDSPQKGSAMPPDPTGKPQYKIDPFKKTDVEFANKAMETDMKVNDEYSAQLNLYAQAEQRLNTVAQAFKAIQSGGLTTNKAEIANILQGLGADPSKYNLDDPTSVYNVLHEQGINTLQQLKTMTAGAGSRITNSEFVRIGDYMNNPNLPPATNLQLLGEAIGAIHYNKGMIEDWNKAGALGNRIADGYTMRPNDFERKWQLDHKMNDYVEKVKQDIGPLKGMEGNNAPTQSIKVYHRINGKLVAK